MVVCKFQGRFNTFNARDTAWLSRLLKKVVALSFRGAFFAEESLRFLNLQRREIPRFARNDSQGAFSATCVALVFKHPGTKIPRL